MSTLDICNEINQRVLDLWREEFATQLSEVRCPQFYSDLRAGGVLFLGCNPSLPGNYKSSVPMVSEVVGNPAKMAELVKSDAELMKSHPYFSIFYDISGELGMHWSHVDWFFQRLTSQSELQDSVTETNPAWSEPVALTARQRRGVFLARGMND